MEKELEQVQATQAQADTQATPQAEIQDIEKIKKELEERFKAEIAGLNRKVSEAEKKAKELEKSKMTAEELAKAEKEELEAERNALKARARELAIKDALVDVGLPKDLAKSISGETEEEIRASAKALKGLLDAQAKALADAEIQKRFGGKEPVGGKSEEKNTFQSMYDDAKKRKDIAGQLEIKRQAYIAGATIKEF